MNNEIILIGNILGAIFQTLYTCLFILYTKRLKNKRFYFIILTIIDYIIIEKSLSFKSGIPCDLLYVIALYINLKIVYPKETRITDLITYIISEIILGLISIISYFAFGMNIISLIFAIIIPIIVVIILSKKLCNIENLYNKYWNRKRHKTKIKSITVRGISLCITILVSLILHFWMIYLLLK